MKNLKNDIFALIILLSIPAASFAQKDAISLGSCEVKEGILHGQYRGEMLSGKPHGKGSVTYSNGDAYDGEYHKGKRQGFGVYSFADGEKYEGQWYNNQQHGKGVYYFQNNNRYDGLIMITDGYASRPTFFTFLYL